MATNPVIEDQKDRRRYFRIDDQLTLIYNEIPDDALPDPEDLDNNQPYNPSLTSSVEQLTHESRVILKKIDRSQPEVADFLKVLERKIDLITQAISMNNGDFEDRSTRKVNISASGVAFDADRSIEPGTVLELKMMLPPSLATFATYGKVVYCNSSAGKDDFSHRIGVDFLFLRDWDREILIRYIVKRQMQQLRDEKQSA